MPLFEAPYLIVACIIICKRLTRVRQAINNIYLLSWFPFFLLGALLPFAGVFFTGYPLTNVYASVSSITAVVTILVGVAIYAETPKKKWRVLYWLVDSLLVLEFLFASIQMMGAVGLHFPLVALLKEWDINSQARLSEAYVITNRACGTFINANVLGVWAVITFAWNLVMRRGALRIVLGSLALLIVGMSQSRGSAFALAFCFGLFFVRACLIKKNAIPVSISPKTVLATFGILAVLFVFTSLIPSFSVFPDQERWVNGARVLFEGADADQNFAARVDAWRAAVNFVYLHPFGTLGPPQVLFILPPDNCFIYVFLQGSLPYVASLLYGVFITTVLILKRNSRAALIAVVVAATAVNGISCLSFLYYPALLVWLFFGYYLSSRQTSAPPRAKGNVHSENGDTPSLGVPR
jgi:hypothetical protein